jgi:hypothetical protein
MPKSRPWGRLGAPTVEKILHANGLREQKAAQGGQKADLGAPSAEKILHANVLHEQKGAPPAWEALSNVDPRRPKFRFLLVYYV